MAQHNDLIIDDQTGSDFLPDLNTLLTAILTQNSGNDEPSATVPFMFWAEPDSDTLWQRNAANDGWVNKGKLSAGLGALAFLSSVGTDQIADGAITSGKIANGTAGKYLGFDGSGNPAELDPPSGGVFSESYESSDQTITASSTLNVAHGLTGIPSLVHVVLKCVTAESGYSVGDEVIPHYYSNRSVGGFAFSADATNVTIITTPYIDIANKGAPASNFNITMSKWRYVVRAYK
jgi:hypothetical protein